MSTPAGTSERGRAFWPQRAGLAVLMGLLSVNLWTGSPLLAVWAGSKVQAAQGSGASMTAVFVVVVILAVLSVGLTLALGRVGGAYDRLVGRPDATRQVAPWLRSMRGERTQFVKERQGLSGLERMLVVSVVIAAVVFEIWFFLVSGSSIG